MEEKGTPLEPSEKPEALAQMKVNTIKRNNRMFKSINYIQAGVSAILTVALFHAVNYLGYLFFV